MYHRYHSRHAENLRFSVNVVTAERTLKPHSYGENFLMCANLHVSRFAHVSKSKFAFRRELCTVSKYLKHHLKLGNRLLQICEFSQKLGVSLLFKYIGLQVDVPDSEKEQSNIQSTDC